MEGLLDISDASPEDRQNNNVLPPTNALARPHEGSLTLNEGYFEDRLPELTLLQHQYEDPSLDYEFVNTETPWISNLDNSDALLKQLSAMGIRVQPEYLTLDIDATDVSQSRTASLSTNSEEENSLHEEDDESFLVAQLDNLTKKLIEAEILALKGNKPEQVKIQKTYASPLSLDRDFQEYLKLVQSGHEDESGKDISQSETGARCDSTKTNVQLRILYLKAKLLRKMNELKENTFRSFQLKLTNQLKKLRGDEISYDAVTPDSGIHETFAALSPEEQEKQREEWKSELTKTEDEIQTLRQVLGSKVKNAQDLKRRLGITVWREFSDDFSSSFKSMKESPTVQRANEVFTEFSDAVTTAPIYQKTAGAMGAVGEKTAGIFGGITAKFGALKETGTFKSFESVYSTAKSKVTGSESNSTQDFEEALREAEAEKAAADEANGTVVPTEPAPAST